MGDKLGQVRSTSEVTQLAIILGASAVWGVLWGTGLVGPILSLIGLFLTIVGLHGLTLLMGSLLEVFEDGFSISDDGKPYPIGYDELKSIAARTTDHFMNGGYVGSRAEITFERRQGRPWFRYECDYRRGGAKEKLLQELIRRCSEAIQATLLDEMKQQGVVRWTDEVSMSSQGFLLQRPGADAPLVVPFDEIEDVQVRDNELRIWKQGDAVVPFYTQQNDTRNFIPLYDLFCSLCKTARKLSDKTSGDSLPSSREHADLAEHAV